MQISIQKFQCKHGIVCTGTPDSTGYGTVGPKTRVKIEAVAQEGVATSEGTVDLALKDMSQKSLQSQINDLIKLVASLQKQLEEN